MLLARNYLYISNKEEFTEVKSSLKLFCFALTLVESNVIPLETQVIPQGFEPWTHALEGRCSNPTELRNPNCGCKGKAFFFYDQIFIVLFDSIVR